jgi:hypothetical protein
MNWNWDTWAFKCVCQCLRAVCLQSAVENHGKVSDNLQWSLEVRGHRCSGFRPTVTNSDEAGGDHATNESVSASLLLLCPALSAQPSSVFHWKGPWPPHRQANAPQQIKFSVNCNGGHFRKLIIHRPKNTEVKTPLPSRFQTSSNYFTLFLSRSRSLRQGTIKIWGCICVDATPTHT